MNLERSLGVVIIHYGRAEPTRHCLRSVLEDPSIVERHIAVVDNFGNLKPEEFGDSTTLIHRPDNPGFGGGANAGVAALRTKADCLGFIVMNNDLVIESGFLDTAAEALEPEDVGAVGGPILVGLDQPTLWYAGGTIRRLTGTVRQSHSKADAGRRREVGFVPGTAIAVRADAWFEIDGFDTSYFLYNEDIDLCLRLKRTGRRLLFEPGMTWLHDLGETTGSSHRSAPISNRLRGPGCAPSDPAPTNSTWERFTPSTTSPASSGCSSATAVRPERRSGPSSELTSPHWPRSLDSPALLTSDLLRPPMCKPIPPAAERVPTQRCAMPGTGR